MPLVRFENTIGGRLRPAAKTFECFDPFTGKPWALIPRCTATDVDEAVAAASKAVRSKDWAGMTPSARGKLLTRLADLIAENAERFAA
ncbi:MAG: aldehyde dehydrogenase family protein, partial [Rhodospirillaceae bacterium]